MVSDDVHCSAADHYRRRRPRCPVVRAFLGEACAPTHPPKPHLLALEPSISQGIDASPLSVSRRSRQSLGRRGLLFRNRTGTTLKLLAYDARGSALHQTPLPRALPLVAHGRDA